MRTALTPEDYEEAARRFPRNSHFTRLAFLKGVEYAKQHPDTELIAAVLEAEERWFDDIDAPYFGRETHGMEEYARQVRKYM